MNTFELSGANANHATNGDFARPLTPGNHFVEVFALDVAVKNPRDRRVTPVDDPHTFGETSGLAQANVSRAIFLFEANVSEVRRVGIDLFGFPRLLELVEDRALVMVLLEQGRLVFGFVARDHRLAQTFEFAHERSLRRRLRFRHLVECCAHLFQQRAFFFNDLEVLVFDVVMGGAVGA